jgi:uncharacterized membrane protein YphA (DoxX/SURF4 family)
MPIVFVIGRVVFVLYFIFAGLQRLMDVTGSADYFAHKFVVPPALDAAAAQLTSLVGLSTPTVMAMLAGVIELAAGLLMAFNVGARAMAVVLIVLTAIGIYYGDNFWDLASPQREVALVGAVLHLSLIGGLLVFVALGGSRYPGEPGRPADV